MNCLSTINKASTYCLYKVFGLFNLIIVNCLKLLISALSSNPWLAGTQSKQPITSEQVMCVQVDTVYAIYTTGLWQVCDEVCLHFDQYLKHITQSFYFIVHSLCMLKVKSPRNVFMLICPMVFAFGANSRNSNSSIIWCLTPMIRNSNFIHAPHGQQQQKIQNYDFFLNFDMTYEINLHQIGRFYTMKYFISFNNLYSTDL